MLSQVKRFKFSCVAFSCIQMSPDRLSILRCDVFRFDFALLSYDEMGFVGFRCVRHFEQLKREKGKIKNE